MIYENIKDIEENILKACKKQVEIEMKYTDCS